MFKLEEHCLKLLVLKADSTLERDWKELGTKKKEKKKENKLLMSGSLLQRFRFNFSGVWPGIQKVLDGSSIWVGLRIPEPVLCLHGPAVNLEYLVHFSLSQILPILSEDTLSTSDLF